MIGMKFNDDKENKSFESVRNERLARQQKFLNTPREKPTQKDWERTVPAAKGFHGIINHRTHFLIGEKGPERVNITPIHKKIHHERKNKNYHNINLSGFVEEFKW